MAISITDSAGNAPSFKQWESGRTLLISGLEDKPTLRFAGRGADRALVVPATAADDDWVCKVPNLLLQFDGPLAVSIVVGEDEVQEVYSALYTVSPRMKPQDYTYEENIGYIDWKAKSATVNSLITEIQAKLSNGDFVGAQGPRGLPGPKGDTGAPGSPGSPGEDGVSPTVEVEEITGGHRVTITDAEHPDGQSFDVMDGTADGDAVNFGQVLSMISTNTAFFRGTFATKAALQAVLWQTTNPAGANFVTNNDYAVVLDDESQNDECWRYVYVSGTGWQAQYRINETPLTAAQLAALNSGATAQNIAAIAGKAEATSVAAQAVVGSGGVISFKNAGGTELFTVALPIYSGGVT